MHYNMIYVIYDDYIQVFLLDTIRNPGVSSIYGLSVVSDPWHTSGGRERSWPARSKSTVPDCQTAPQTG